MAKRIDEVPEYRQRRSELWQSIAYFSVLAVLSVFFLFNFVRSYRMNLSLRRTHDSLLTEFAELHHTNSDLDSLLRALQYDDPEAIEWVARYQWHLARPGEQVFQLIPEGVVNKR
jgi:cell division protein FtsB